MTKLERTYRQLLGNILIPISTALELQLKDYLAREPRIDRIGARAKSPERFLSKARTTTNGELKYSEPLRQIQDQIGARLIVFYPADVERVSRIILKYYRPIEARDIVPDSEWEFSYFGRHYILVLPSDVMPRDVSREDVPRFFELQIKTLFQRAWSEANHDLGYKPGANPLSSDEKRRLAFASAQAWGADRTFDELFRETQAPARTSRVT